MKKKNILYLILPLITLILELLPYGAVLNFANPEGEPWRETYSYFSLTPFGYANFAPFITAVMTCIMIILLMFYIFTEKNRLIVFTKRLVCICCVISLVPVMMGLNNFSIVGLFITISLIAQVLVLHFTIKNPT